MLVFFFFRFLRFFAALAVWFVLLVTALALLGLAMAAELAVKREQWPFLTWVLTRLEEDVHAVLTGRLDGEPVSDEEKAVRMRELAEEPTSIQE